MLLALDGFIWNWAGASISVSATASFSVSITVGGGGSGHKHHHHWGHHHHHGDYQMADDDYWTERRKMLERHHPRAEEAEREERPVEVVALAKKHDRLLEQTKEITNLPDLSLLLQELDLLASQIGGLEQLSTRLRDIQLQSDEDDALMVLLLA